MPVRRRRRWVLAVLVAAATLAGPSPASAREPLCDAPVVWYAEDDAPIPVPEFREPGLVPYAFNAFVSRPFSRFFHPGRLVRSIGDGDPARPAANVNALDEVVDSSWFTNRIGLFPMSDAELAAGPGLALGCADGPDRSEPWTIIGAKTSGVTPGFRIRDARGDVWLLKFDPPHHPGMTIRAGAVASLIFHAVGYNVPVDRLVKFDRNDLAVGEGATMRLLRHGEVPMTEANLDSVLAGTNSIFAGRYHTLASRYLDGVPLGPFDDQGTRDDDPNDTIKHQDRRELRGYRVFSAWLNHFDTKMHNSLDMYVGEPGAGHVKHHLIDFASTLGAYGDEPVKRFGYEFGIDVFPILGRTLALGLHEDDWVQVERPPGLEEVGLFVVDPFDPAEWKPDAPNSMMANCTKEDGYWAAKIVSAFSDEQIALLVAQGHYQDPAAAAYLTRTLIGRRDTIARHWFKLVPPLDFFRTTPGGIEYHDLAVERGYRAAHKTRYRYRLAAVDAERDDDGWTDWVETDATLVPLFGPGGTLLPGVPRGDAEHAFLAIECQTDPGRGWSPSTTVYRAYGSGRIVGVDR